MDKNPVALELSASRGKGSGIDREVCIQSETVFDEAAPCNGGRQLHVLRVFRLRTKYYGWAS